MKNFVSRIFDAAYIILISGIIAGTVFSLLFRLDQLFPNFESALPDEAQSGLVLISIVSLAFISGRFIPLMSVTAQDLLYNERSIRVRTGLSVMSVLLMIPLPVLAALVAPEGQKLIFAGLSVLFQLLIGIRPWKLSRLLKAGSARVIAATLIYVQDSELVSASIAESQMQRLTSRGTNHPLSIVFRRFSRRWYLPFLIVFIIVWALSLSYVSPLGAVIVLSAGHILCFAGVLRIMNFGEYYTTPLVLKALVLFVLSLLSAGIFCLVLGISPLSANSALFLMAIAIGSWQRSLPRIGYGADMVETDFGFFSLSLFRYFTGGFWLSSGCMLAALLIWK